MVPYIDIFGWQSHSDILMIIILFGPIFAGGLLGFVIARMLLNSIFNEGSR